MIQCGNCQGDCDTDDDCEGFLKCYQRTATTDLVPGCSSNPSQRRPSFNPFYWDENEKNFDYCYIPDGNKNQDQYDDKIDDKGVDGCTPLLPCGNCQGDCDTDDVKTTKTITTN